MSAQPKMDITPNLSEARRLRELGFSLVRLVPYTKQPLGKAWNEPCNFAKSVDEGETGYGFPLASNGKCSIDPDNVDLALVGLEALGFDLEALMYAGARTISSREGSGGRSIFTASEGLSWLKFNIKRDGVSEIVLELRAKSPNLQDVVPGIVYRDREGVICYQEYDPITQYRIDNAPELPKDFLEFWRRCSVDMDYLHEQQRKFAQAISEHLGEDVGHVLSVSGGLYQGKMVLAFEAPGYRQTFDASHRVEDFFEASEFYAFDKGAGRWRYTGSTGASGIRPIPDKNDLWQSDHGSDPLNGTFDAWSCYVVYSHNSDVESAKAAWSAEHLQLMAAEFDVEGDDAQEHQAKEPEGYEERRERQKKENERIGEGADDVPPKPEIFTLREAEKRFVFLTDGSQVADREDSRHPMALSDWQNTYAASIELVPKGPKSVREVAVTTLWRKSKRRMTVTSKTFKAGGKFVVNDPEGRLCINTWKGFQTVDGYELDPDDGADMFFEHIKFLFGDEAEAFVLWLAHIQQKPGVLPHSGWLHIAENFGMGRNWIASVLTRLWCGYVAANVDLPGMLNSGFNGQLSRKVLAIVDEIREGGGDKWAHNQKMKSLVNEEQRTINPKYGRQSIEFNSCRWLLFSNHLSAIPLDDDDRRWNVSLCTEKPKSEEYYAHLYGLLDNPRFIPAVAERLNRVNLKNFNPGAHAKDNAAKRKVREASRGEIDEWADDLLAHWPSDLIDFPNLSCVLTGFPDKSRSAVVKRVMERVGFEAVSRAIKMSSNDVRKVVAIRNTEKWIDPLTDMGELKKELEKAVSALAQANTLMDGEGGFESVLNDGLQRGAGRFLLLSKMAEKDELSEKFRKART